jgi:hypothetical protein
MAYLNRAIQLSPENALARYRRAKMLITMKRYQVPSYRVTHCCRSNG